MPCAVVEEKVLGAVPGVDVADRAPGDGALPPHPAALRLVALTTSSRVPGAASGVVPDGPVPDLARPAQRGERLQLVVE